MGTKEIADARAGMGWTSEPFVIPQEVYAAWDVKEAGAHAEAEWNKQFDAYRVKYSAEAAEFVRRMNGELPAKWAQDAKDIAEREGHY